MVWDFSKYGLTEGAKNFLISLLKSAGAIAAAYIAGKLLLEVNTIASHLDTANSHYELYGALAAVFRSAISGFLTWVKTYEPKEETVNSSGLTS